MTPSLLFVVRDRRVVAELERLRSGQLRLRYLEPAQHTGPLSISMPVTRNRHQDRAIRPWVEGLFPDRPQLLQAWRRHFGISGNDPFDLLAAVGEDVAGAAQFVRPDRLEGVLADKGQLRDLSPQEVADLISGAMVDFPIVDDHIGVGRFSLAGAQAKIALQRTERGWALPSGAQPSSHILKPAIPNLPDQELVELLVMRTAKRIGLAVANVALLQDMGWRVLVVERFDRDHRATGWVRIHQEDCCQALGIDPARKYEADGGPCAATIAGLITSSSTQPETDINRFVQAVVFNALIGGTDAHARNYALLQRGSASRLAPLYDLNSWAAYGDLGRATMSMSIGGTFRFSALSRAHWRRFAVDVGVAEKDVFDEIARQRELIPAALLLERGEIGEAAEDSTPVDRLVSQLTQRLSST